MPRTFQTLGQNDVVLPAYRPDPGGTVSYRYTSDTLDLKATAPDYATLKDVVRVGLCGPSNANDRCARHTYFTNDGTSRCMIQVNSIEGSDPFPGDIHFAIRQSTGCIPTVRFDGIWSPGNEGYGANGLLVQIQGMLSTAWEVQMEIVPNLANPTPTNLKIVLEFLFDRLGGTVQPALKGPLVTSGSSLPAFP